MADFVVDNTSLPFPKQDLRPLGLGLSATKYSVASDWNTLCQAVIDTRSAIKDFRVNVKHYGARGNGVTPDNASILEAINTAAALNATVFFPEGTYILSRDGTNSWCVDCGSSTVGFRGVPGKSILKHAAGMPAAGVSFIRANEKRDLYFRDLIFDGNWGNHVTEIEAGSAMQTLPQSTIYVADTGDMPTSGTLYIRLENDNTLQTITYSGKTANSFTGCSGGTGVMYRHDLVGYVNTNTSGINHAAQGINPSNFGIILRGCENVTIENCIFRDMFGDGVWIGTPADDDLQQPSRNIKVLNCVFDICARNGVTFGASVEGCVVSKCVFRDIFNTAIDSEPNYLYGGARNIVITENDIRGWWSGSYSSFMISVVGGDTTAWNISGAARNWRIENNTIHGIVHIDCASDIVVRSNQIKTDNRDPAYAYAPVYVIGANDGISIEDNWIYDTAAKSTGSSGPHNGAIHVSYAGAGTLNAQPAGIRVANNRVFARGGLRGIWVNSQGGQTFGLNPVTPQSTGVATAVTNTTLTNSGAAWSTNQWAGWSVRMGNKHAMIISNTATVLTLQPGHPVVEPFAWRHPLGRVAQTPTVGTYTIYSLTGLIDIDGNHVDCGYDGNSAGGEGIYLFNDRAGGRISVKNNRIKNAATWAIQVVGDTTVPTLFVELVGNRAYDDQASPTTSAVVRFASLASLTSIGKLIMRDNGQGGGSNAIASLSLGGGASGSWIVNDGNPQDWAGHGTPEGVVTAPVGSSFRRINGGAATTLYIKESGTGNTGWIAK